MRFDDSLATVLAGDTASRNGASAAWRQLVDLVARNRVPDPAGALARLRDLRARVPTAVRAASARTLAQGPAPAPLVTLFAEDEPPVATVAMRTAVLDDAGWLTLLPKLTPALRSVLRHRRDLPDGVRRGLESFGATDFVLEDASMPASTKAPAPFVTKRPAAPAPAPPPSAPVAEPTEEAPRFEIADLVARLDRFRREQPPVMPAEATIAIDEFPFHADAAGVLCWVEGVARGPLIGVALASLRPQGLAQVSGLPMERGRAFRGLCLSVAGDSTAAGRWRLAGEPRFDAVSGALTGYAGVARRADVPGAAASATDGLRQLIHELRTPANAIAGFAELIGTELLGPVALVYRERALLIGEEVGGLTAAIDDLDMAARLESEALELHREVVDLVPLLRHVAAALEPQVRAHGAAISVQVPAQAEAHVDLRAAHRLLDRLLAVVVAAAAPGERLEAQLVAKTRSVRLHVTRPAALPLDGDDALLTVADGGEHLLLGAAFTLGLVRALSTALGGSLSVGPDRLTLRLPAVVTAAMEQAAAR